MSDSEFSGGSGSIESYNDLEVFRKETGASSVMLARVAEHNVSIFRENGLLPLDDVIRAYLKIAVYYDNHMTNSKYCVQQMLGSLQTETGS